MIKANELRLGNFILFNPLEKVERFCLIKRIEEKKVLTLDTTLNADLWLATDETFPIPLTPEILEKAGFEKNDLPNDKHSYQIGKFKLLHTPYPTPYFFIVYNDFRTKNNYVHQLQNLFFALTNKELEINLTHLSPSLP